MIRTLHIALSVALSSSLGMAVAAVDGGSSLSVMLREGWAIQPASMVNQDGTVISTPAFNAKGWYPTSVPTTILAALVRNKVYPNPYWGKNLALLPGTEDYANNLEDFSNLPMPQDSPFRSPWWFRDQFQLPASWRGRTVWLHFGGINYRANIWLNGHQVSTSDQTAGTWRVFDFDVSNMVSPDAPNVLAVEVSPPQPDDLGLTWVDWNPAPPDKDTGLWRDVYLTTSGAVELRWPNVVAKLDLPSLEVAHLVVTAELHNSTDRTIEGVLRGQIENVEFAQKVELGPNEVKVARFSPDKYPQLNIRGPHLWWPAKLGPQDLYNLKIQFETSEGISDAKTLPFGIREVTSELNEKGYRVFSINGRRILIRGGGWAPDMLLRASPDRQEAEIRYVLDMNLNAVRMEGKLEDDNFLNLADRHGLLILAGWCCCDQWEHWQKWNPENYTVSAASLRDQIRRFRTHPSVFDWLNGSDNPPIPKVEETYIDILKELDWPNPYQSSATQAPTEVSGPTGLKMTGPYEYVPPVYWLTDIDRGGAFGFNTETSPGAAVPPIKSLREFLPPDHLWPVDDYWDFHSGRWIPTNLKEFSHVLAMRYGPSSTLKDFVLKAQVSSYEGERAMFEAFGRNKYNATGVIQWMLNNGWPSVIWHLYDYYLRPGGGYFGAKKGCEPLHIQYSYDDHSVVVVNSYYRGFGKLIGSARLYDLDMNEKYSNRASVDIQPDSVTRVFAIPQMPQLTTTYFLRLELADSEGKLMSSNFYWLSTKPDILDWDRGTGQYTPEKSFADLGELAKLAPTTLKISWQNDSKGEDGITNVSVQNPSNHLAFFIHLSVLKGSRGDEILPVRWEDNYFSLLPGEKREISAIYSRKDVQGSTPVVTVDGWNINDAQDTAK
jgi:exo-1,4-beta-D-glucosaminidase